MHPCSFSNGDTINLILTLTLTSDVPVAEAVNNREEQITVITTDEHLCSPCTEL